MCVSLIWKICFSVQFSSVVIITFGLCIWGYSISKSYDSTKNVKILHHFPLLNIHSCHWMVQVIFVTANSKTFLCKFYISWSEDVHFLQLLISGNVPVKFLWNSSFKLAITIIILVRHFQILIGIGQSLVQFPLYKEWKVLYVPKC